MEKKCQFLIQELGYGRRKMKVYHVHLKVIKVNQSSMFLLISMNKNNIDANYFDL